MEKTANQLYKESGSDLSFAEWIEQEKQKGVFIKNDTLNKIVESVLQSDSKEPYNPNKSKDKFLGLSKPVLIISSLIIVSAIVYKIYTNKNQK